MRIHVLHQEIAADADADERDVLDQANAVAAALARAGHDVVVLPVTLDLGALTRSLRASKPDLVFNLVESLDGADRLLPCVPSLLESLGCPHTGNQADALYLTTHKLLAKQRLRAAGLPTPDWIESTGGGDATSPMEREGWLLKSVWDHASAGVHAANLLRGASREQARHRLRNLIARQGGEWFAEAYVEGREFNLSLLEGPAGVTALPPAEIQFLDFPADKPRILDYEAKWNAASFAYTHTPRRFDFPAEDAALLDVLKRLALACWQACGLRGYARVDFRTDAAGHPFILEINANPCLSPDAGFAAALEPAGISYDDAIARIVNVALGGHVDARQSDGTNPTAPVARSAPAVAKSARSGVLCYRRELVAEDVERIRNLVASTGYFHESEVAVAVELAQERLRLGAASGYEFLFAEEADGTLAGYSCFGPTPCTQSSFDLYWIAVAPAYQGHGLGRELDERTRRCAREMGGTRIYAETSGRPQYASTRAFYERCGYALASMLDDFYAPGDGKATYLKTLA
ncbi:MAG: GNAT family N-acetyltransferase [Kiritimatiellae bacterium]|nr:GNAT family N-acetyltransferase [Kiritimatiellia bacterium]